MRTARFWIWENGPVKLSIRPGQTLRHGTFSEDEEGWSSRCDEWMNDGERVIRHSYTDGRDCDGRLYTNMTLVCTFDQLEANYFEDDGVSYQEWERIDSCQRDYAAEAMGY